MFVLKRKYLELQAKLNEMLQKENLRTIEIIDLKDNLIGAKAELVYWQSKYGALLQDRTELAKLRARINSLGGERFLNGEIAHPYIRADLSEAKLNQSRPKVEVSGFSEDELKSLLQLVHPDKHGGKDSAVRMTQLINKLRG